MAANSSSAPLKVCYGSPAEVELTMAYVVSRILLTSPPCVLVLVLGWRRSFKPASHSDIFTYHLASMELLWCLCGFGHLWGQIAGIPVMKEVGFYGYSLVFYGEAALNALTCVERYLAVVHPVTYLGLKGTRGVRIRAVTAGCVWLLSSGLMGLSALYRPNLPIVPLFCCLVVSLLVVSFCSLSTLCVLTRPGPGGGGDRKQADPAKQKAFLAIMAVLAVLCVWFAGFLVAISLYSSPLLHAGVYCTVLICMSWFNLPSSLVLPLLHLHRAGTC